MKKAPFFNIKALFVIIPLAVLIPILILRFRQQSKAETTPAFWRTVRHFQSYEFDSPFEVGSGMRMKQHFIRLIDEVRHRVGFVMSVSSGFRTPEHNSSIKNSNGVQYSSSNSPHMSGIASDVLTNDLNDTLKLMTTIMQVRNQKYPTMSLGIGIYGSSSRPNGFFIHFDTREHRTAILQKDTMWTGNDYPQGGYRRLTSQELQLFKNIFNQYKK